MADAITKSTTMSNLVETAFDTAVAHELADMPIWRQLVDKRPGHVPMPGDTVTMSIFDDLDEPTTSLTEGVDPDAVALGNPRRISITPTEEGQWTKLTSKLQNVSFADVTPENAFQLAKSMANRVDTMVRTVASAADNGLVVAGGDQYVEGTGTGEKTVNDVTSTDTLSTKAVATAVALLRRRFAAPRVGDLYLAYVHPDVAYDIRADDSWLNPHVNVDTSNIYAGVVGSIAGATFIESARVGDAVANTQTTPVDVYSTYFLGREALAEAVTVEPHTVAGTIQNPLNRFVNLGWYGYLGFAIYRQEALEVVKTTSSIATL